MRNGAPILPLLLAGVEDAASLLSTHRSRTIEAFVDAAIEERDRGVCRHAALSLQQRAADCCSPPSPSPPGEDGGGEGEEEDGDGCVRLRDEWSASECVSSISDPSSTHIFQREEGGEEDLSSARRVTFQIGVRDDVTLPPNVGRGTRFRGGEVRLVAEEEADAAAAVDARHAAGST